MPDDPKGGGEEPPGGGAPPGSGEPPGGGAPPGSGEPPGGGAPPESGGPPEGAPPGGDPPEPGAGGDGPRRRARTALGGGAFGPGGWARRMAKLWGFLGFCVLVLIWARHVVLPFVFGVLIAYILAPIVRRLSARPDGERRMPRGLAIILCYIVFLALVGVFLAALLPRLSKDVARIGSEAPALYEKVNDQWAPAVARWLEERFPSMAPPEESEPVSPVVADVPVPPGTQLVVTPLPDGRFAVQLSDTGLDVASRPGGGVTVSPSEESAEELALEDRLRKLTRDALAGLQSQLGDIFRFGQTVIRALVKSVFTFFLVLMIAAFILLDLEKIHGFARGLIPAGYRDDYDDVAAGIDRGLSGVIRGQLLICLVNGVLTWVGLMIFEVKYALILAVVAGVLSLIPIFGSIISTIPIVLAALVSSDSGIDIARGVFILAWIVGIHFLEANLLNPKIIGTSARIHPVLVIFALVVGEHGYGLAGALLAVPVASIVQNLFLFFRQKAWKSEPAASPGGT